MENRSHVDVKKIKEFAEGEHFEYRDVVQYDFPVEKHPEDGALFNEEVENGLYGNIVISNEDKDHVKYRKV